MSLKYEKPVLKPLGFADSQLGLGQAGCTPGGKDAAGCGAGNKATGLGCGTGTNAQITSS